MKLIPLKQVMEMTSLGRSTIYRYISENKFPKQIALGAKNSAWIEREVLEWIATRVAERNLSAPCAVAEDNIKILDSKKEQIFEERDQIMNDLYSSEAFII